MEGSATDQSPADGVRKDADSADLATPKQAAAAAPIFFENPDGTITEAIPSTYEERQKSRSRLGARRSHGVDGDSDTISNSSQSDANAAITMYQEVDFLYSRHEKVLVLLLACEFLLEALYNVVYVLRTADNSSVVEFMAMYNLHCNPKTAEALFWSIFVVQFIYAVGYYVIAVTAIWMKRPKQYRLFANYSIFGIAGLFLLAYIDKFNLIIFFLRLLVYIYARFLQGLTASMLLLPPLEHA